MVRMVRMVRSLADRTFQLWCYVDYEEWFSIPGLRVVLPGAETMYVDWYEEDLVSWFNVVRSLATGEVGAEPASLRAATARIVALVRPSRTVLNSSVK